MDMLRADPAIRVAWTYADEDSDPVVLVMAVPERAVAQANSRLIVAGER
jgi:hypothetical protein